MKRIFTRILTISLMLLCIIGCMSCGASYDNSEFAAAIELLVPRAHELYTVIYGDGIEHEAEPLSNGYYIVTDERFSSEAELRSALAEVFTEGYAKILCNTAFTGVSSDEGAIGAKFKLDMEGNFTVKPEATAHFAAPRTFDTLTLKIVKQNRFRVTVSMVASDGEVHEVTLQREKGEWRIDSPLF